MRSLLFALLLAAACGTGSSLSSPGGASGGAGSGGGSGSGGAGGGTADAGPGTADAGNGTGLADAGPFDAGAAALQAPPAGQLYHGVLPAGTGTDGDVSPANLDAYEAAVGRKVAWVYFDDEWLPSRAFPIQTATWIRARGAVPFIRLMMRSQRIPLITDPTFTLDRILAGEFDGDLAAWADQARAFGSPLIVEYGTEVNGDWNPWSAEYNGGLDVGPDKFKRAFRHLVGVMRGRGASNITWALHYNVQNFPGGDPRNVPSAYYPGDDVVDWVGVSAYGSERSTDSRCPSFRSLVDGMAPQLRAATTQKPFFIFEFGITSNNPSCPSAPWISDAFADLLGGRWPEIRGFSWWNQRWVDDPAVGGVTNMEVQSDPQLSGPFRAALTGPDAARVLDAPILR